ncbi:MAG: site-2 protease family protein [Gemmatimonadales bacterium]
MDDLIPFFSAWRVMHMGTREIVDGLVAPDHRGPSPALGAALRRWPGSWYWSERDHARLTLVRPLPGARRPAWTLSGVLFLLTIACTLAAGTALAGLWFPYSPPGFLGAVRGAADFLVDVVAGDWRLFLAGWSFGAPLLAILLVHELGHYVAARRYEIDTSPPVFLPIPPTLSPVGSLGAFIRLRSPVLDRRQLLDVGAAGPLAGFVVALLVLIWGYRTSDPAAFAHLLPAGVAPGGAPTWVEFAGQPIVLGDSLLTRYLRDGFFPGVAGLHLSLPAFAGWVGAFITGLNLLPLSQLDGGHVLYGLLGRGQRWIAGLVVLALIALAQVAPTWYIWVVMTFLIGGGRWTHPSVVAPERPVPASRRWVGLGCVAVFVITFVPFPFAL